MEMYRMMFNRMLSVTVASGTVVLAHAEQLPDNSQAHGPTVVDAANGVPIVQITAPTAAGVSHNQYQRFNVDAEGVVLNNSATLTQTQLGGWIGGNPNLSASSARIILNEVTGTSTSALNGYTEVGGQRAEVIIANPNGITCNGCGFINASRGLLTTGKPEMDSDGGLVAFNVSGSYIDIGALGFNTTNTDQVDLLARAVTVNGQLWANHLNVVTGTNRIEYASLATRSITATDNAPQVSLDVAALGGMYANRIRLIGTEAGVGVSQAGELMSAGELTVTVTGEVTNTGLMTASGAFDLQATTLNNQGTRAAVASWDSIDLSLSDALRNTDGALLYSHGAMTIRAPHVLNESAVIEAETMLRMDADDIINRRSRPADIVWSNTSDDIPGHAVATLPGFEMTSLRFRRVTDTPAIDAATLTPEAQILSGDDMTLNLGSRLLNDSSVIVSGGVLSLNGAPQSIDAAMDSTVAGAHIINQAPQLIETVTEIGVYHVGRHEDHCKFKIFGSCVWDRNVWRERDLPYYNAASRNLPTLRALIGADVAIQGAAVSLDNTFSVAPAVVGNTGDVPAGLPAAPPARPIVLPDNGLYQVHLEPDHPYLYELDPRFATRDGFLSSDYFLNQLGLSPANTLKRLGDGFYEQKLVQEQILQLTGRRLLNEFANNEAEFKALMDTGVALAQEFELKPGMVLSATQVASLTHDLVWFETKVVKGQSVLVPVVYLARVKPDDLDIYGPIMASNSIDLKLTGDLANAGTIVAHRYSDIEADNVLNQGGTLQGGEYIRVTAQQDVVNRSGNITGGEVTLNAGRDVINATSAQSLDVPDSPRSGSTLTTTLVGDTAVVSGDTVTVQAGRDVTVVGADITARHDLLLHADRDVVIDSLRHQQRQAVVFGNGNFTQEQTTHLVSTLNAGGELNLRAGQDIQLAGSAVKAGGDVRLQAERDINAQAVANQSSAQMHIGKDEAVHQEVTHDLTSLKAGGSVLFAAGQDATLTGVSVDAGKDIIMHAERDTHIGAVVDSAYDYQSKTQQSTFGKKKTTIDETLHETAVGGQLTAGGDILVNVSKDASGHLVKERSGDINMLSTQITAQGTVGMHADGDVNVDALMLEDRTLHQEKTRSAGGLKKVDQGRETVAYTPEQSTINAGGDVRITAGRDANLTATELTTASDAVVKAGNDVNLFALERTIDTRDWKQTTRLVSMDTVKGLVKDSIKFLGVATGHSNFSLNAKKKHEKSKDDLPQVRAKEHFNLVDSQSSQTHDLQYAVSSVNSGGETTIVSGRDLALQGSDVAAADDLSLQAGHDLNLQAVADQRASESHSEQHDQTHAETNHHLATLQSGSNITLLAGQDANLIGTAVTATNDIVIHAERDTNISAALDSVHDFDTTTQKGSFGKKKTATDETLTETAAGGALNAGGNVLINVHVDSAGRVISEESGNVNLLGAAINAQGSVVIAADEDINASAIQLNSKDYHQEKSASSMGMKKSDRGNAVAQTGLTNTTISAGLDVLLTSSQNIKLIATNVIADGNINLEAVDQLLIAAGDVTTQTQNWAKRSGVFTGGSLYEKSEHKDGETAMTGQAANIIAGGAVRAQAGQVRVVGSNISGDKGVTVLTDSGDIDVTTYQAHRESYSKDKEIKVGMGDVAENLSRPDQMVKSKNGRLTMTVANANYDEIDVKTTVTKNQASRIESEGNVILNASAGSINVTGSNLAADTDGENGGAVALSGATGVNVVEATDTFDKQTKEIHGEAELSVVVQHQAVELVMAAKGVLEAREKLSKAKREYKEYERNLDQLKEQLTQLESDLANKVPGVRMDDVLELRELVGDVKDDAEFYQAGIALAAVNLATSITTLVQQTVAAAASTGTWGFNAGIQLDIDATKTTAAENATTARGSTVSGNQIAIETGVRDASGQLNAQGTQTTIKGSQLVATKSTSADEVLKSGIAFNTGDLNLIASKDTHESKTTTEHGHITAQVTVYGAAGGASISGSFDRNQTNTKSTTVNNSQINADNISIATSNDLNIAGANVRANEDLQVNVQGNMNLESLQNRSSSRSHGMGVSAGAGIGGDGKVSSVNGGANVSNGMTSTRETVLTSLTSGGTADVSVKGHTQITGALLGTMDAQGQDLNKLNFTTGSLTATDLRNTNVNSQTSAGFSTSVGIGDKPQDNPANTATTSNDRELKAGTSNVTFDNSQQNSASKTLATLGRGNITVGGLQLEKEGQLTDAGVTEDSALVGINRDTANLDKSLWNSDYKQSVDASIDHRFFTEDGRSEIKLQLAETPASIQKVAQKVPSPTGGNAVENFIGQALDKLSYWTGGVAPSNKSYGGILAQLPVLFGAADIKAGAYQVRSADDPYVLKHSELFMDATALPYFDTLEGPGKERLQGMRVSKDFMNINVNNATYQNHVNGMLNNLPQALVNGLEQTGSTVVTQFYNPTHGFLGDLLESGVDKVAGTKYIHTGVAAQTGQFLFAVVQANGTNGSNVVGHSQGALLLNSGLNTLTKNDFLNIHFTSSDQLPTFFINGAPVRATTMQKSVEKLNFEFSGSNANQDDPVAEVLGGNRGLWSTSEGVGSGKAMSLLDRIVSIKNFPKFGGDKYPVMDADGDQLNKTSPHSTYSCMVNCGDKRPRPPEKVDTTRNDIKPEQKQEPAHE